MHMPSVALAAAVPLSADVAAIFVAHRAVWLLEDTNAFRVTINKTAEGNLTTAPINGAIFMIDPLRGDAIVGVLPRSVWSGPRRPNRAKLAVAQSAMALLHDIPTEMLPNVILATREGTAEELSALMDIPGITVGFSAVRFDAFFFKLPQIRTFVDSATDVCTRRFTLYGTGWLNAASPLAAMLRVLLLTLLAKEEAERIAAAPSADAQVWQALTDEQFAALETAAVGMIPPPDGRQPTLAQMREFLIRKDVSPVDERSVASEEAEVEAMLRAARLP